MRYTCEEIGANAGKIWESLSSTPTQTLSSLEKTTGLKKEDLLLAIGWLMKEEKLFSERFGKSIKFSLK
jgi:hypothetical protein